MGIFDLLVYAIIATVVSVVIIEILARIFGWDFTFLVRDLLIATFVFYLIFFISYNSGCKESIIMPLDEPTFRDRLCDFIS